MKLPDGLNDPKKSKRLTTKDIARLAGVSQSTVSRVLTGYPYIKEDTKDKVIQVIKDYGYKPNSIARSMVYSRTQTLGLIVADVTNPFYSELAKYIINRARQFSYSVIVCNIDNNYEEQEYYISLLEEKRVDGIICASSRMEDEPVLRLSEGEIPCVLCNRHLASKRCNYIASNNRQGAVMAVEHLIGLGHRKIGFVNGPDAFSTSQERLRGYKAALEKHGIGFDLKLVGRGRFDKNFAYVATEKLLDAHKDMTAVFACSDVTALSVIECVEKRGMRVPGDIAVVGYDDIDIAKNSRIGLTTVAQKKEAMGRLAVDKMMDLISSKRQQDYFHILLEPELVVRESCGSGEKENTIPPAGIYLL